MSHPVLDHRITQLQGSLKQTAQLIAKLSKTQTNPWSQIKPDVPGSDAAETGDTHESLSAEIHENLKQEEDDLELLQQDIEDLNAAVTHGYGHRWGQGGSARANEKDREYRRLKASCSRITEELRLLRARFRRAQLQAKKNRDLALQREQLAYLADLRAAGDSSLANTEESSETTQTHSQMRANLLYPSRRSTRLNNNSNTKEDSLLTASSDLTSSLRRTHDLLTSEVSRSRFAQDTLIASNSALEELNKRYGTLDDLLARSRGLLGSLLRSQKSDTWYLETALYILLGTMAWLLFRRLLYGPAWWILWQPSKLLWTILSKIFAVVLGVTRFGHVESPKNKAEPNLDILHDVDTQGPNSYTRVSLHGTTHETTYRSARSQEEEQSGPDSLMASVSTIIDSTRTSNMVVHASPTNSPEVDKEQTQSGGDIEDQDSSQNPGVEQEDHKNNGDGSLRRGDGEALKERDPVKEPPNPNKRMWEEPKAEKSQRDEL